MKNEWANIDETFDTIDYLIETFDAEVTITNEDAPIELTSQERRATYAKMMREI